MRTTFALLLTLLLFSTDLSAQAIRGRLVEADTGEPIMLARILLLQGSGQIVDETVTDESGYFSVASEAPGSFFLRAERLGYSSRLDGVFELGQDGVLTVEFRLERNPVTLDTLDVSVERQDVSLELMGFYERQRIGFGKFLGPEEIERKPAVKTTDLLRMIPRVRIKEFGFGLPPGAPGGRRIPQHRSAVTIAGSVSVRGEACYPVVLIDGIIVSKEQPADLDSLISPSDIRGIEVYRGQAEMPLTLPSAWNSCGAIVLWTR